MEKKVNKEEVEKELVSVNTDTDLFEDDFGPAADELCDDEDLGDILEEEVRNNDKK